MPPMTERPAAANTSATRARPPLPRGQRSVIRSSALDAKGSPLRRARLSRALHPSSVLSWKYAPTYHLKIERDAPMLTQAASADLDRDRPYAGYGLGAVTQARLRFCP